MKKLFLLISLSFSGLFAFANHITGGEILYSLTSQDGTNYTYHVTLKLYRDCNSNGAQLDNAAPISIFNTSTGTSVWANRVNLSTIITQKLGSPSQCINNPPPVCYQVGYYEFDVTLPASSLGYTITYQRCCRIAGINNVLGSSSVGATFTAQIPGTNSTPTGPANNSARFVGADTVIICAGNSFCYDFGAKDNDADSLGYEFCSAYVGGSTADPAPDPPDNPPYGSVPYAAPFSESSPMGPEVTLDNKTGMMCGIAPSPGIYVVTVCVTEYRKGIAIATQRKDLQIKVGDCSIADAALKPEYISCDGFTYTFSNEASPSPLIHTYYWDFGDGATSDQATPAHTYADTGTYSFKLVINRGEECRDSAISKIKVYPGFFPDFTSTGICINKPTSFRDLTSTRYGVVDTWTWDFGVTTSNTDISSAQNPVFTYPALGTYNVRLIVTNSKGCIDTVYKPIEIVDKPPLKLAFKDTLICNGDPLQLHATGSGIFSWTPLTNIVNENTPDPTVTPPSTTKYIVQLDDNGCINKDTVQVRVVDFVTLTARQDTLICAGDSVRLGAFGDGLRYFWTPVTGFANPNVQFPMVRPDATTTYQVRATIGSCSATDDMQVILVPYPGANAGPDTLICFNTSAQLHAQIAGSSFTWSPVNSLSDPSILDPVASPKNTTTYVLTVRDNIGCPKPGFDSITVKVLPKVNAFAGKDTAVVVGQPLQFSASGGVGYIWSPPIGLNQTNIFNPIGIYDGSIDSIRYQVMVVDEAGCMDSASVRVKVFRTEPKVFVPSAFTPNGDGKNDYLRPIAVGLTKIEYFRIYNRWGQLVFSTTVNELGWDGTLAGKEQASGTYVWLVRGVDFTGKAVFAKGTATLIR